MPVLRPPAPGLLGSRPPTHWALLAAPQPGPAASPFSFRGPPIATAPFGHGGPPVAPPPTPPTYGAYGASGGALAYSGAWDPALLAALQQTPSPATYSDGGDWFMDSSGTAHMSAHPGHSHHDGTSPM
nr:actin cytoskeleton-regulatory complex protein PAN1-like [Aegilops tauschii subsp. strangulata]